MEKSKVKKQLDPKDLPALKRAVKRLEKVSEKKLNDAICDIIDLGGYSVAVLLESLKGFNAELQLAIVKKIEDFLYFHPDKGVKVFDRIKKVLPEVNEVCRGHLLAALSDISETMEGGEDALATLADDAAKLLSSGSDLMRASKAIDIAVKAGKRDIIPDIIKLMIESVSRTDNYQNYQFIETSLLALKRLGGEPLLRLLINHESESALRQIRLEWRNKYDALLVDVIKSLDTADSDFAQVLLKIIDLSEFNLPFSAMISEGLSHPDKWVRQSAASSMQKAGDGLEPESLSRLLSDEASEVRLMAVTSLGGFDVAKTGVILEDLALRASESFDVRLNALYALYSQKNLDSLVAVYKQCDNDRVYVNAIGLASLLMPHSGGVSTLIDVYTKLKEEMLPEALHYVLELFEPEDLSMLASAHSTVSGDARERVIELIKVFAEKKSGDRLNLALQRLNDAERSALKLLIGDKAQIKR
ncbi:MAG: HEAT repeat domain-containing protein [Candidatus Riflebacteria bacterium]|nr:HEAT repeat domain-containing protein [Candidatus Riflebacteria bacterium]